MGSAALTISSALVSQDLLADTDHRHQSCSATRLAGNTHPVSRAGRKRQPEDTAAPDAVDGRWRAAASYKRQGSRGRRKSVHANALDKKLGAIS